MNVLELFKPVSTFVFDVDGVLTDGMLMIMPGGLMARRMNIKDGYALQLAVKKGYHVVVISGGNSPEVQDRLHKLGVQFVYMKADYKKELLEKWMQEFNIQAAQVLYMGDDIPDYDVMQFAGIACCPADAAAEIKQISKYISPCKGGEGCARDVIEKVMRLHGHWGVDTNVMSK